MISLLLSLAGCGGTYADFGKFSWWVRAFLKSVTVVVYDRRSETEFIAGTFKTDFEQASKAWAVCRERAENYAHQNNLADWEYHCCGKTFWSDCVRF